MIKKITDELCKNLYNDFKVKQSQMVIAEKEFINSLDENQFLLYENLIDKREAFFTVAQIIYQRKIK